jgi:hypothetical protein
MALKQDTDRTTHLHLDQSGFSEGGNKRSMAQIMLVNNG